MCAGALNLLVDHMDRIGKALLREEANKESQGEMEEEKNNESEKSGVLKVC